MLQLFKKLILSFSVVLFFSFQSLAQNVHNLRDGELTGPYQVTPGMVFDMDFVFDRTNFNGTTSNITFQINTYISEDPIYQPGVDVFLAGRTIINMPPSTIQMGGIVYNVTFPANLTMPAGRLYYITVLDATNVIAESNETDNISAIPFYYTKPGTDAAAISITNTTASYNSIQPIITLDATIINAGSTNLTNLEYRLVIGTDPNDISQSVYSTTYTIPSIPTTKIETIQSQLIDLSSLSLVDGNYFVFLQVDPNNLLTENYETNNTKVVPFSYTNLPATPNPVYLMNVTGHQTIQTCNAVLYDDGGPTANARNAANGKLKIYPVGTNNKVTFTLNELNIWDFDYLYIYDAAFGTAPVRTYRNTSSLANPETYTSKATDGALEIVFVTDGFSIKPGFKATLTCSYEDPALTAQTITFNPLPAKLMTDNSFALTAVSSSGLPISYISTNPAVATISGNTVTVISAGTTVIQASQNGDDTYKAAVEVFQTLTVSKASQVISFDAFNDAVHVNDPTFTVSATATSGLPVTFVSSNTSVVSVSNTNTITIVGAGTATITAQQAGNATYGAATSVVKNITVSKLDQTITFNNIDKVYGNPAFTIATTSSSGLALTYSISTNTAATLSGTTVTIIGAGTASITVTQAGNAIYNAATITKTLTVAKAPQTISFAALTDHAIGDAPFALSAISSSGLAVTFISTNTSLATVSGSTVTIVGQGITTISAQQAGNANYLPATDVVRTLVIDKTTKIAFDWAKVSTFAGSGVRGTLDGTGTAATFSTPIGIVCDKSGNLFVSDQNSGLIRKITPAGEVTIFAGSTSGFANGTGTAAKFNWPSGMAIDKDDNIYVADQNNHRIRKITPQAVVTTYMGTGSNSGTDGALATATVSYPEDVTFDAAGNMYVAAGNKIRKITPQGIVSSYAGSGNQGFGNGVGTGNSVLFLGISGITVDPFGNLFAVDGNQRVRKIAATSLVVSTYAGSSYGYIDGPTALSKFGSPKDVFSDAAGNILVMDSGNHRIRLITVDGLVSTIAGDGTNALLNGPSNMCMDKLNNMYVTNQFNQKISKITPYGLMPFSTGAGAASDVQLFYVSGNVLTENLLVTAPSGYEISLDPASGFTNSSLSLTPTAGSVASTPIYIRISASTIVGDYNGNISLSSAGAYNKAYSVSGKVINKTDQTITFNALGNKKVGDANFNLTATASSTLTVTYTSSNPLVATVTNNVVTIVGVGTTTITAIQTGNNTYNAAPNITQELTVSKADQTISFAPLTNKFVGDADFNLTATTSSALPVTYTSSNALVATITNNVVTIVGAGTTTITAIQSGNATYNPAPNVTQELTVSKIDQTISFAPLTNKFVGDADFDLIGTVTSGLEISFTSSNPLVATVTNNVVTIVGAGKTNITAIQSGNDMYNAAAPVTHELLISTTTGISLSQINLISVYPNPCTNYVRIESGKALNGSCKVNIYNLQGILVYTEVLNETETNHTLTISDLAAGAYIIEIVKNNEVLGREQIIKIL